MKLSNLPISKRIWLLAIQFTMLVIAVGGVGAWNTIRFSQELEKLGHLYMIATRDVMLVDMYHDGLAAQAYKALEYANEGNRQKLTEIRKEYDEMAGSMIKALDELAGLAIGDQILAALKESREPFEKYRKVTSDIISLATNDGHSAAMVFMPDFESKYYELNKRYEMIGELVKSNIESNVSAVISESEKSRVWILGIVIVGVLLGLAVAFWFVSDIFKSLSRIADAFHQGSRHLGRISNEIGTSSSELEQTTTEQSSAIEETVSSMEQMGSMISQTSQNSEVTRKEAEASVHDAQEGRQVVGTMVEAMRNISASNDRLGGIVAVIEEIKDKTKIINDIAFETRLLAFNASIEAARAGAHGRGFAVVAEEVGKLANVSGKAADEVRNLLDSSISEVASVVEDTKGKVNLGHVTSQSCEQAFTKMERSIGEITNGIERIAQATKEQDAGVRQANRAMVEMEKVTQSNSRNAENLASHASNLKQAANEMQRNANIMNSLVLGNSASRIAHNFAPKENLHSSRDDSKPNLIDRQLDTESDETGPDRDDSRWNAA